MLRKLESRNNNSSPGDSNNGQLLRDIEEISKALYLNQPPSNNARSQSAGRVRLSESKSSLNPGFLRKDSSYKDKKSSLMWNWKKPLKVLTHFGNKKFHCCFYLHIHSIEGLPPNFENLSFCVHWKRKNEVVQSSSSRVSQGVAEFDETLMHQCSVYGSSGGTNHPVKYEPKLFLLYVSVVEAPGMDIGKQWVDLTSFLPRTLEELEGEKSCGKWTTCFNLLGKAKGASLNVSFGFWIMRDKLDNLSGNSNVPKLLNMLQHRPTMDNVVGSSPSDYNRTLQHVGSIQGAVNYGSDFLYQSFDVNVCREVLLRTGLELSKSINCLYHKLDEGSLCISAEADSQQLEEDKPKLGLNFVSAEEMEGYDWDITELSVTEVGTEISESEHLETDQGSGHTFDEPAKMGHDVMEVLQNLALVGAEKLYMEISELIPLEDITGKTIKQVAHGAASSSMEPLEFSCLEDLSPLVVNKIEALFLEGLKIQARMSNEEPPSCIYPLVTGTNSASGDKSDLVGLSITLDDWLRLDAGNFGDEEQNIEHILKVLDAHHAKCVDLASGKLKKDVCLHEAYGRKCGLLGNNLTIAHLVQLRNPLRNYEPVGVPMLLLIQVQRAFDRLMPEGHHSVVLKRSEEKEQDQPLVEEVSSKKKEEPIKEDEDGPQFRIAGVHLTGVNTVPPNKLLWGTTAQQQSGSRWLLASGMGRYTGCTSKSKAIVKSSPLGMPKVHPGDILWSISTNVHELEGNWKDLATPHARNPDVIFRSEDIRQI